jgi:polyisoprenoid-binding protein YceI
MRRIRYVESFFVAAVSFGLASCAVATDADWDVAADSSTVKFHATQQGSRFEGRFGSFEANIDFDPASPSEGSIVGVVELDTVDTRDYDRDATLRDADFFDIASHPQSRFESQSIEVLDEGSYRAHGELTLKGITRPMAMDFTFDTNGSSATFTGTMDINRFDFKVGDGWNDTSWIGERVSVEVSLELAR